MLTIIVGDNEFWDSETEEFVESTGVELTIEHSLVSLSKWESKFEKAFLGPEPKSVEETIGYIEMMILTPNFPRGVISELTQRNVTEINAYIESKQSATTFGDMPSRKAREEIITSELIYYWMIAFNIPWEAQHWHLNRLFSLIRVCNIKNQKPKKMSKAELARRNHELNERRRAELGTRG